MATITAYKYGAGQVPWTDNFKFETGPTINLESEKLTDLPNILKNIWDKDWDWVVIKTENYRFKFYKSGAAAWRLEEDEVNGRDR